MSELGRNRHQARERALEISYEASIKGRPATVIVVELATRPDDYVLELLNSAERNESRANELISEFSIDWPLDRIALIDRLIMTLAIGEMLMESPPPLAVILDEAVEMAKVYSTDGSSSFVNGVLSSVADRVLG
ncbi:MAG: transcription antitermination factor NusB [Acidimicrobiales bacterium]